MKIVFLVMINVSLALCVFSQTVADLPDDEDFQSWNDVTLTVPMSKRLDYFNRVTLRIGDNVSNLRDGRFMVGVVWKPTKALSISPFFWYINARNAANRFRVENRLNLSASYRFPIKKFGLLHRSTYERRLRRPLNSWRYRAMMTVEKDIPEKILAGAKVFVSDEIFYDSLLKKFSRNRFSIGVSKTITKQLSLDVFYMRQNDGFSRPGDLNTVWTAWKIKL